MQFNKRTYGFGEKRPFSLREGRTPQVPLFHDPLLPPPIQLPPPQIPQSPQLLPQGPRRERRMSAEDIEAMNVVFGHFPPSPPRQRRMSGGRSPRRSLRRKRSPRRSPRRKRSPRRSPTRRRIKK